MSDSPVLVALAELHTTLTAQLGETPRRLDTMSARLEQIEGGQGRMRIELMDRIDRLQNHLTSLQDDVAVNFGRADTRRRRFP